ncbi:hypothetical protein PVAP13_8NG183300 [Panicum virgatum]|uniref:Uncharacterized protein n=1 Tax=Panicum virgatum TaxID=38727 RepID=A0A8T0P617_PANVG|nr:hypothetical protein PVAP13_8NG183300 [Panicum virgatum]
MYSSDGVNFHLMWSSWLWRSWVSWSISQSVKYPWTCRSISPFALLTPHIQVCRCSAAATVLFFGRQILKRFGAISFGLRPWSHPKCQKLILYHCRLKLLCKPRRGGGDSTIFTAKVAAA